MHKFTVSGILEAAVNILLKIYEKCMNRKICTKYKLVKFFTLI